MQYRQCLFEWQKAPCGFRHRRTGGPIRCLTGCRVRRRNMAVSVFCRVLVFFRVYFVFFTRTALITFVILCLFSVFYLLVILCLRSDAGASDWLESLVSEMNYICIMCSFGRQIPLIHCLTERQNSYNSRQEVSFLTACETICTPRHCDWQQPT